MKRTAPTADAPLKRAKTHRHHLQHTQQWEVNPLLASQDEAFFRTQLLRSIALAVAAAGFDTAKPSALEQLLGMTENFMDRFLLHVRTAMTSGRRATPTAQDFIHALAHTSPSSAALLPHVRLDIPAEVVQPALAAESPDILSVPQLDPILGSDLSGAAKVERRTWIPPHLPALPSRHAWQATPVFSTRETDALKIREKATEGGVQAEKSLRRLAKAEKAGVSRLQEHIRKCPKLEKSTLLWEKAMGVMREDDEAAKQRDEESGSMAFGFGLDGADERSNKRTREIMEDNLDAEDGARVNWETRYWRRNAAAAASRA